MERDVLSLNTRRRIYEVVCNSPGLNGRGTQRAAATGRGETIYHLNRLIGAGLIQRERFGREDHYFAATIPVGDRRLLGLISSASVRRVLIALVQQSHQSVSDLKAQTGLSGGRLSIHLGRLVTIGVIRASRERHGRTFEVVDPSYVIRVLTTYRPGITDAWVERLSETWSELFRR
ncbi:MAG: hypothetical protein LVQ64_03195 [Thermoplasmatales archaeon]|nr:hypothetical protein [Thermoplasmatales archaeon]